MNLKFFVEEALKELKENIMLIHLTSQAQDWNTTDGIEKI